MAIVRAGAAELGFAEEAPAWRLRSKQFPSKVGGRPAWLGEAGLPGPAELACSLCGRPLAFVLQLYAPLPGRADAFHRGLFLFCCRAPPCCAGLRGERGRGRRGRGAAGRGRGLRGRLGVRAPPPGVRFPAPSPPARRFLIQSVLRAPARVQTLKWSVFRKRSPNSFSAFFRSVGLDGNWIGWSKLRASSVWVPN